MTKVQTVQEEGTKQAYANKITIILSKGSIDMVYPALMIANTGIAMGMEVHMFFTFWGMSAINKKKYGSLKVSPVGNPGMPMPNLLGMIPGMTAMATRMIKGKMEKMKQPPIPDLIKMAHDMGVKLHACTTTMDVMGIKKEDLIEEVENIVGAATMLELSKGGQIIFI
jgi:peroxiredoxin family protein